MPDLVRVSIQRQLAHWWSRLGQALRSYTIGPFSLKDPALNALFGYGRRSVAGPLVNEFTMFTCAAVYDAINQISSDTAKLPLNLHKRRPDGGSDHFIDSKAYKLMKYRPNPETNSMAFRRQLMVHALVSKGGFAEIVRDGAGRPAALWNLEPERVDPYHDDDAVVDGRRSPRRYRVDGRDVLDTTEILHIAGIGWDQLAGFEMVQVAREAIGLALASQAFAAAFFGNGTRFGGVLSSDQDLDEDQKAGLRAEIEKLHAKADKAFRLLVLGAGFKYTEAGVKPNEAQMKELRDQQVAEVARFYNMPLHKLKLNTPGAVSYASVEMADLDYYKGTLLNWLTLLEEEYTAKLVAPLEIGRQYFKHNANAFLRGDINSRYTALGIARDKGIINADEWRELEDMNPQSDGQGKVYLVQSAQIPVNKLSELVDAQIAETKQKAQPPAPPATDADVAAANDRAERAEQLAVEAQKDATSARERVAAAEASGTVTEQALTALRADYQKLQEVATNLTVLSTDLRERCELIQTAKDVADEHARQANAATLASDARASAAQERLDRLEHAHAEATAAVARAAESEAAARADLDAVLQRVAEAEARATLANTTRDEEAHRRGEAERLVRAAQDTLEAIQAESATLEARAAELSADVERTTADLARLAEEAEARSAESDAARLTAVEQRDQHAALVASMTTTAQELQQERDTARTEAEQLATTRQQLEQQIALLQHTLSETQSTHAAQLAALQATVARMEQDRAAGHADRQALEARARAAESAHQAQRAAELARLESTLAAHRALFLEAVGRMVRREVEKARRHQATPAKLRAWVTAGDAVHADVCQDALLPAVRTHLAWTRSEADPQRTTTALVEAHLTRFRERLTMVADVDGEDFHVLVGKALERWEQEEPPRIADQVLREAVAYLVACQKESA